MNPLYFVLEQAAEGEPWKLAVAHPTEDQIEAQHLRAQLLLVEDPAQRPFAVVVATVIVR